MKWKSIEVNAERVLFIIGNSVFFHGDFLLPPHYSIDTSLSVCHAACRYPFGSNGNVQFFFCENNEEMCVRRKGICEHNAVEILIMLHQSRYLQ